MDDTTQLIPDGTVKPEMAPGSPCSEIDKAQGDLAASANYFVVDPAFLATASYAAVPTDARRILSIGHSESTRSTQRQVAWMAQWLR